MLTKTGFAMETGGRERDDLPARPEDIDLERVVADPDYRAAVKMLLRRWGVYDDKLIYRDG